MRLEPFLTVATAATQVTLPGGSVWLSSVSFRDPLRTGRCLWYCLDLSNFSELCKKVMVAVCVSETKHYTQPTFCVKRCSRIKQTGLHIPMLDQEQWGKHSLTNKLLRALSPPSLGCGLLQRLGLPYTLHCTATCRPVLYWSINSRYRCTCGHWMSFVTTKKVLNNSSFSASYRSVGDQIHSAWFPIPSDSYVLFSFKLAFLLK